VKEACILQKCKKIAESQQTIMLEKMEFFDKDMIRSTCPEKQKKLTRELDVSSTL